MVHGSILLCMYNVVLVCNAHSVQKTPPQKQQPQNNYIVVVQMLELRSVAGGCFLFTADVCVFKHPLHYWYLGIKPVMH